MKKRYLTIIAAIAVSITQANAQTATQIYDHDSSDLTQLFNMPYDESRMLVASGPAGLFGENHYYEFDEPNSQLIELTFNGVDEILSLPTMYEDKIFFAADLSGLGVELSAYDGTSTYFFDLNFGAGNSDPELISFEDDLYVIANNGTARQLFKYLGGTSFQQISEDSTYDVVQFIANRGDEYFYTTYNAQFGRRIKRTEDNNGSLVHSIVAPVGFQEVVEDVVMINGNIHMLSVTYSLVDASYRVDRIDGSGMISTNYFETGGSFSSGHLFGFDGRLLYYRTEPGFAEVLDLSTFGQPATEIDLNPSLYNYISGHAVQNGKFILYGEAFIVDVSTGFVLLFDNEAQIQANKAYQSDDGVYLYEINTTSGDPSGVIEVNMNTAQIEKYTVSTQGAFMNISSPMVLNNGNIKFIFSNTETLYSSDIYSFAPLLSLNELEEEALIVFPNPSVNGDVNIELASHDKIVVASLDGKIVQTVQGFTGINSLHLKESGVYIIRAKGKSQKVIVQ